MAGSTWKVVSLQGIPKTDTCSKQLRLPSSLYLGTLRSTTANLDDGVKAYDVPYDTKKINNFQSQSNLNTDTTPYILYTTPA